MASATANGIRIEYEAFGDRRDPVILLIMGFAMQMVVWPEPFCRALAERSFRVIRFDNRDVGLSTHLDGVKAPSMVRSLLASLLGIRIRTPYTLDDMALDTVGLLDALDVEDAHIVGASMGGMIGQIIAAKYPTRVRTLTSMMSTSGKRGLPGPRSRVLRHAVFKRRSSMSPDEMFDYLVAFWQLIGSPAYPVPNEERKRRVRSWIERAFDPRGSVRQFAAMTANGDRTSLLRTISRPTLVIHGAEDPLIPVACGRHTAACIANSRLHVIPRMGHDLPEPLMPEIVELIATHCSNAQNGAGDESERSAATA